jgi:hypothetical protein
MKEQKEKLASLCTSMTQEMKEEIKEEAKAMKGKGNPSLFIRKLFEEFKERKKILERKNGQQN